MPKKVFGNIATHQLKPNMDFQTNVEVNGLFSIEWFISKLH